MKKLTLAIIAAFINLFGAYAQDESEYKDRKLSLQEVNFVSSYYHQEGNNAAVTGGIGTEKLTDFANQLDIKLLRNGKKDRSHVITASVGIDNYTSASSDKIDPSTISSASAGDTRVYPKLGWTVHNEKTGWTTGAIAAFSMEFDYQSSGLGLSASKLSADKNKELSLNLMGYFDRWKEILPIELRPPSLRARETDDAFNWAPRNSLSASLVYSQVMNRKLHVALLADAVYQSGLLGTRFHRVYFSDGTLQAENLPGSRFKVPVGIRVNYFMGNRVILRSFFRYYTDNWGLKSYTADIELPVKINPYLSVSPHYRYYDQSAVKYFAPYGLHSSSDVFYTSDYDLSKLNSQFIGGSIRWAPENGVFGIKNFAVLELRYGHYIRSTGLRSDIITAAMKFK
ncbi:MAG: DUF3570 domain-containing protein [Chitinophagales bacterium]|nr:DUF3570 domain-containing protein [Chitinophagales bacterium]